MITLRNQNQKILAYVASIIALIILLIPVLKIVITTPFFGDSAAHANTSMNIVENGLLNTDFAFPPLYNLIQAGLYLVFGNLGLKLIILIGLVLFPIASFLLSYELSKNKILSYLSAIFVVISPKIIYYSSRMYMEVFLSSMLIFSIWAFVRYLKKQNYKSLLLLILLTSITSLIKQQGLFILFPSILLTLIILMIFKNVKTHWGHIILYTFLCFILIMPGYLFVFRTQGRIIPISENNILIKLVNNAGRKLSGYSEANNNQTPEHFQEIKKSWEPYRTRANTLAANRHTKPLDPFLSLSSFAKINLLFSRGYRVESITNNVEFLLTVSLIAGFFIYFLSSFSKSCKNGRLIQSYVIFSVVFLFINYYLFQKNTDQARYHLFIPVVLVFFLSYLISKIIGYLRQNTSKKALIFLIPTWMFLLFFNLVNSSYNNNLSWDTTQIYRPSKGGIYSIAEVGSWIKSNLPKDTKIFAICGTELRYYSRSNVGGSYIVYFADTELLNRYFKDNDYEYLVLLESQFVNDEEWKNYCWNPTSFVEKIDDLYPVIYQSEAKDIFVYKIS